MVVGFLIAFVVAIVFGLGITVGISMLFPGGVFFLVVALWFAALGLMVFVGIKVGMRLGLVFIFLMIFGAIIPFVMGWVP